MESREFATVIVDKAEDLVGQAAGDASEAKSLPSSSSLALTREQKKKKKKGDQRLCVEAGPRDAVFLCRTGAGCVL